jgi:hypothetical protein
VSRPGDGFVLVLMIAFIVFALVRKWISASRPDKEKKGETSTIRGDVPALLRRLGYEVVREKERVPFTVEAAGQTYESRLFIDYIARKDGKWFLVIVARERKPLRMSGAGLRDFFLSMYLLYRPEGILYVDRDKGLVKPISFDVPSPSFEKERSLPGMYPVLISFGLGLLLAWLMR